MIFPKRFERAASGGARAVRSSGATRQCGGGENARRGGGGGDSGGGSGGGAGQFRRRESGRGFAEAAVQRRRGSPSWERADMAIHQPQRKWGPALMPAPTAP